MSKISIHFYEGIDLLPVNVIYVEIAVRQHDAFYRTVSRDIGDEVSVGILDLCPGNVAVHLAVSH